MDRLINNAERYNELLDQKDRRIAELEAERDRLIRVQSVSFTLSAQVLAVCCALDDTDERAANLLRDLVVQWRKAIDAAKALGEGE